MIDASKAWKAVSFDSGTDEVCEYILNGGELYYEDSFKGWSFLNLAAHVGNKDLIEELLRLGYDVNYVPSGGNPAIYEALDLDLDSALQKENLPDFQIVIFLFLKGARLDVNRVDGTSLADYCNNYGTLFRKEFDKRLRENFSQSPHRKV